MATLIGTYEYYLWTADQGWLNYVYPRYQRAMAFITAKIDGTGLLSVTGTEDWGRVKQGGRNTEANMLMYKVLTSGSQLATWAGDSASSASWSKMAATLKVAVNKLNFDAAAGFVCLFPFFPVVRSKFGFFLLLTVTTTRQRIQRQRHRRLHPPSRRQLPRPPLLHPTPQPHNLHLHRPNQELDQHRLPRARTPQQPHRLRAILRSKRAFYSQANFASIRAHPAGMGLVSQFSLWDGKYMYRGLLS